MNSFSIYQKRPIRFVEIFEVGQWKFKVYSISSKGELAAVKFISKAKNEVQIWIQLNETNAFKKHGFGTLILHEFSGGCFAIINWWIDENMLQHYVYLTKNESEPFQLFSSNGIVTCVWESAVIWFERNAWVKHVLQNNQKPDFESYLQEQLNEDV